MNNIEILAPAGGKEQLIAAVRSGADAVYFGTKSFNARQNAENFGNLKEAVSYCHSRGVKVHIAVNTLVTDNEISKVYSTAKEIAESDADAVIVQDLAIAKIFRECVPSLSLHASTQLTAHNISGVKQLEKLGFSRVVLSRELSLEEIKNICKNTSAEIEVFIHGSLCMCMSGCCYISSMLGGRSGNRGLCAQACRLDFSIGHKHHALSLKDMCHIKYIQDLINAGVCSLKIEGRMKRPEYVAAAVRSCKNQISGKDPDLETLQKVFSRSGFTDGYIKDSRTYDMFGYRTKDDVTSASDVLKNLTSLYKNEYQRIPLNATLIVKKDCPAVLVMNSHKATETIIGKIPSPAFNRPLDFETAKKQITKTGGTPFYIENFELEADSNLNLPLTELNRMRREAVSRLLQEEGKITPHKFSEITLKKEPVSRETHNYKFFVRAENFEQLKNIKNSQRYILPTDVIIKKSHIVEELGDRLFAEIPQLFFDDKSIEKTLTKLKELGVKNTVAENIGAVHLSKKLGFNTVGGHGLNILNTMSLEEYEKLGLSDATISFELSQSKIKMLGGSIPRGIIGYGSLPLMLMRVCPAKGKDGCSSCSGENVIRDRMGIDFPLVCCNKQYTKLLNSRPLVLSDKKFFGIDFMTLYFTNETPEQCQKIYNSYINGTAINGQKTNGLYFREIQ